MPPPLRNNMCIGYFTSINSYLNPAVQDSSSIARGTMGHYAVTCHSQAPCTHVHCLGSLFLHLIMRLSWRRLQVCRGE